MNSPIKTTQSYVLFLLNKTGLESEWCESGKKGKTKLRNSILPNDIYIKRTVYALISTVHTATGNIHDTVDSVCKDLKGNGKNMGTRELMQTQFKLKHAWTKYCEEQGKLKKDQFR